MNENILNKLKQNLFKKYSDFNKENLFIEIDKDGGFIVVNWSINMDMYVNYKKVEYIKNYMLKFLRANKQEGFFYVGGEVLKC